MISSKSTVVPFPISNEAFLRTLAGDDAWEQCFFACFEGDPNSPPPGAWTAYAARRLPGVSRQRELNMYFCPSILRGKGRNLMSDFVSLNVIVVDDYGVKVPAGEPEKYLGPASYMVETSPNNYQAGWFIKPICDLGVAQGMLKKLAELLGAGDNLSNVLAWRRLPVAVNGKAAYVVEGKPWSVRLTKWDAARVSPDLGDFEAVPVGQYAPDDGVRPSEVEISADPIMRAFRLLGLVRSEMFHRAFGWMYTVECPWLDGHTQDDGAVKGAEYVPVKQKWRCQHATCQLKGHRKPQLMARLDQMLDEASGGTVSLASLEPELFDPVPGGFEASRLPDISRYEMTEDGLTIAFVDRHKETLRFDHSRGKWFQWTGGYWRQDETQHAFHWARELAREYRREKVDEKLATLRVLGKIGVAGSIERAARADVELAVGGADWDQGKWLCGVPGGELDLLTGLVGPCVQEHLITKQLAVAPAATPTPVWDQFLADATGGDVELIRFLRAWSGYCLTADVSEERFVFFWGPGGNGKGTFLFTINAIVGDYAVRTAADTFMLTKYKEHSTELARLAGARMVIASEIEEGRTFNVVRVKDFTGRDGKLAARFMNQDFFEFLPQFKLIFVGNNQPRVTVDEAMKRRIVLIPFVRKPAVADPTLKDRLVSEYPGILAWMIAGELDRKAQGGLAALLPRSAMDATAAYLDGQNCLAAWASERCLFSFDRTMSSLKGFEDYRAWCFSHGEPLSISQREFSQKFCAMFTECEVKHTKQGNVLTRVELLPDDAY